MKQINFKDPLWLILLGAFIFRMIGLSWGLPNDLRAFSLHPDEQVNFLYAREIVPGKLDFTPSFYNYGTLYLTLLRFVSDIVGTYSGGIDQNGQFSTAALAWTHLAGRFLNVIFGTVLVGLSFGVARRIVDLKWAILSAAFVAVSPALLVHSRFQTVDMLAAMLTMATVYCAVRILDEDAPVTKLTVWGAVCAGLSMGTKYIGIVAIFALIPALIHRKKLGLFVAAFPIALLAFLVSTPGAILENQKFVQDFMFELNHSKEGHGIVFAATSPAPLYHLGNFIVGLSPLGLVFGLVGLIFAILKRKPGSAILITFFIVYFAAVSGGSIKFMRYVLPLIPILAVGFGYLIQEISQQGRERIALLVGLLIVGGIDRGGFVGGATVTAQMAMEDPRDAAGRWIKEKGDVGIALASDPWFWSPSIHPEVPATRMLGPNRLREIWAGWTKPTLIRYPATRPEDIYDWDVRILNEQKPEYVSFSSLEYAAVERLTQTENKKPLEGLISGRYKEFVTQLAKDYDKVWDNDPAHTVQVEDMEYVRPRVTIWKRKTVSTNP